MPPYWFPAGAGMTGSSEREELVWEKMRYSLGWRPYTLYRGDEILGNVTLLPMSVWLKGEVVDVVGIAAVATLEAYREMGVARYLMKYCLEQIDKEQKASVLFTEKPAIYEGLGFKRIEQRYFMAEVGDIQLENKGFDAKLCGTVTPEQMQKMAGVYTGNFGNYDGMVARTADYTSFYELCLNSYEEPRIIFCLDEGRMRGYIRVEPEGDGLLVSEICCDETAKDVAESLLYFAAEYARDNDLATMSFSLFSGHFAWKLLKEKSVPIEREAGCKGREVFMVRPAGNGELGAFADLQWSLSDKF